MFRAIDSGGIPQPGQILAGSFTPPIVTDPLGGGAQGTLQGTSPVTVNGDNAVHPLAGPLVVALTAGGVPFAQQAEAASIVVDPAAVAGGNVFNTLGEAALARKQLHGPCIVYIDSDLNPAAQAYDFTDAFGFWNTTFQGAAGGVGFVRTITWAAGTTLSGVLNWIDMNSEGAALLAPLMTPPDQTDLILSGNTAVSSPVSGGPFARALAGRTVDVLMEGATGFFTGVSLDAVGAGAFMIPVTFNAAIISADTLGSSGGGTTLVAQVGPASQVSLTQTGVPGGVLVRGSTLLVESTTAAISGPGGGSPAVQAGVAQLANGTVTINGVVLTASSRISVTPKTLAGSGLTTNGVYSAPGALRNVGAGSFAATCWDPVAGANMAGNTSFVDWIIVN